MQDSLIGTWRIIATEVRSEDGNVVYPDGHHPKGHVIYTADGYFSLMVMRSERSMYGSTDIRGGTIEEKVAAADTFVSYCGRYSLGEGTVTHHIEVSLFPNWVDTDQQRFFVVKDEKLVLSTPPFLIYGKEQKAYLNWEKVENKAAVSEFVVGVWKLVSCIQFDEAGEADYPYGEEPYGYLIYGDDRRFCVAIMRKDRSLYASSDFRGGTAEEKVKAVETFASYGGTYSYDKDNMVHHVEASLFPNWVDTDQHRFVELAGNKLMLTTPDMLSEGKLKKAHLIWERVSDN